MTTNDQMQIRFHKSPPNTEMYRLGTMPLINPAEAVEVELLDGTMLYGTVTAESTEIDGHVRVVTKTVRVHSIEPGATE